jgi:hypothetical protein
MIPGGTKFGVPAHARWSGPYPSTVPATEAGAAALCLISMGVRA